MLAAGFTSQAANIVDVKPISNKILDITFVDGEITYHGLGQSRSDDKVTLYPGGRVTTANAKVINSYSITSCDDSNYPTSSLNRALSIGVNKRLEQSWAFDFSGLPTHVEETHVYLYLKDGLEEGKTYNIAVTNAEINTQKNKFTFRFDSKRSRTENIHINNIGYVPSAAAKYGYIYSWLGDGPSFEYANTAHLSANASRKFRLLKASDRTQVFEGTPAFRKAKNQAEFTQWGSPDNNFLGAEVYDCDFSSFKTPGEYVLSVDGIGCSFPFSINNNIYEAPFYWTMKNLYENRSGIELKTPSAQYNRPICHKNGVSGFKLEYSSKRYLDIVGSDADDADIAPIEAEIKGTVDTWGWYQDAGDWDSYASHWKVPVWLLYLYELNPAKFKNYKLNIGDESNNNLPDLLDEAR